MTVNHALYFLWNEPRSETNAFETFQSMRSFWQQRREANDIASFEFVHLASTRNPNTPVGFLLVTGDRAKLHAIRWEDEEFQLLHLKSMQTFSGYACIDGYAGEGLDRLFERFAKHM